jgi:hypothetical protein
MKRLLTILLAAILLLGGLTACSNAPDDRGNPVPERNNPESEEFDPEPTAFTSYAGALLPLTIAGDFGEGDITATRRLAIDASGLNSAYSYQDFAQIHDSYNLTNHSDEDLTVTLAYPFVNNLHMLYADYITIERDTLIPTFLTDGGALDARLTAGISSAGGIMADWRNLHRAFEGVAGVPDTSSIIDGVRPWEAVTRTQTVTVYEFTNAVAHGTNGRVYFEFNADFERTQIFTSDLGGGEFDYASSFMRLNFFEGDTFYLMILGEDISNLRTDADVSRYEACIFDIMRRVFTRHYAHLNEGDDELELRHDAAAHMLSRSLVCDEAAGTAFADSPVFSFTELFTQTSHSRILYRVAQITLPASESVRITVNFQKEANFDPTHCCSPSRNPGLFGFEVLSTLGSDLVFTEMTAEFRFSNNIDIVRDNLELQGSATEEEDRVWLADLNPSMNRRHYIEVAPIQNQPT